MKKWVFLFVLFYAVSFVSSYYACTNNGTVVFDVEGLDEGETKVVNGLVLGLKESRDVPAIKRVDVHLFLDAQSALLTDNSSTEIRFMDSSKSNISLQNLTSSGAAIKIGSTTKTIDDGEIGTIGKLSVAVLSAEGEYPGNAEVQVLIGKGQLQLSNVDNPGEVVTANGKKYSVEIFSASNEDATIKVGKCENSSLNITEIADPVINNTPSLNASNSTLNNSGQNNSNGNITGENSSVNNSDSVNQDGQNQDSKTDTGSTIRYVIIIGVSVIFIVVIFLLVGRIKKPNVDPIRTDQGPLPQLKDPSDER